MPRFPVRYCKPCKLRLKGVHVHDGNGTRRVPHLLVCLGCDTLYRIPQRLMKRPREEIRG